MGGYSVAHAMMMMIPEAWENHTLMDPARRAFYEYHAAMMEPWDGPASIAFTDGRQIGATLDRNGLRPSRYIVTDDDLVIMGSECGCLPIPEEKHRQEVAPAARQDVPGRPREGPHRRRQGAEGPPRQRAALRRVDRAHPREARRGRDREDAAAQVARCALLDRQQAFGYTQEDLKFIMQPMSATGEEPIGSMGNDSPLAVLSNKNKTLYHYFKQLFAQVTNPAIDPIREELVMSLVSFIGPKPNLLGIDELNPPLRLEVVAAGARLLRDGEDPAHRALHRRQVQVLGARHHLPRGLGQGSGRGAPRLARGAGRGRGALGLFDHRHLRPPVDRERVAIPALLALSAIHQHLVGKGLRTSTGLVVETGSAREVHHFALLGGYGAEAVHPYLALENDARRTRPATRPRRSRTTSRRSARA